MRIEIWKCDAFESGPIWPRWIQKGFLEVARLENAKKHTQLDVSYSVLLAVIVLTMQSGWETPS